MSVLAMSRITIRKNIITGEVLEETTERLPDDPNTEIRFLGQLYANKLKEDPRFHAFCKQWSEGINERR